jgi:polyhydroxyalkanoate synthase subunit PhaE
MNNMQNWTKGFGQFNPFNMDQYKTGAENVSNLVNQYMEMLNYNFATLQKTMQSGTAQDAFRGLMNVNEGFVRFYEMWSPMFKSIQDKTFNMEAYKQMINPAQYKEVMDKMFGFMPEHTTQYFSNFGTMLQDLLKQSGQQGFGGYHQARNMMQQMMPGVQPAQAFEGMLSGYQNFQNSLNSVFAPMAKMIAPNDYTKNLAEWSEIADKMVVYQIKNAEMQYMIYAQGSQVMDKVAAAIVNKLENGEEVNSIMALYQEWLNISDKEFVQLFESDEYSKVMADTASLQMRLRKDIEMQLEKSLVNIPVATRSEIDELHKTIYDLKKQVRQLERMMEVDGSEDAESGDEEVPAAKKAATRKK